MAEKGGGGGSLLDERRCKRSDGKKWRCQRVVMEGRTLCEAHFLQGRHRQHKKPVPDDLKLERQKRSRRTKKFEENPTEKSEIRVNGNVGCSNLPQKRGKRKNLIDEGNPNENLEIRTKGVSGSSNRQRKRGRRSQKEMKSSVDISEDLDDALKKMKLKKGDLQLDLIRGYLNRQIEKKKGKQPQKEDIVKELKYGRLEISQSSPLTTPTTSVNNGGLLNVKVGIPASTSVPTRFFRSKNIDRLPIATMQILPSIKANVKATTKKCHWCSLGSYRVLVKCLTCKKQFFCEDCIRERYLDKADIKKRCPVCHGNCSCRVCIRGRSKEVKTKDLIVFNGEEKFDKAQQLLYMIDLLLPLLEQINQEKIIELEIEAKIKGKDHSQLEIQNATGSQKQQCCFCKACIVDVHRSCGNCSYILCLSCCREFRDGHLHGGLRNFKYTKTDKRKSLCTILRNWSTNEDGSIKCPPKNLGGCGDGILGLFCHPPVNWTKDLEARAKEIVCASKITQYFEVDSSRCALCDEQDHREGKNESEILINNKCLYFSIRQDLGDKNLQHFTKHWVRGQPLILRDMINSESELSWDPISMFCMYLERSAKSRNDKEVKLKNCSDWCEVQIGRQQIFMGGKTHANVWHEKLKFKVWLSSGFFQEHFPSHYAAAMHALPIQQYINPLTGILNLAANMPPESQNPDLGPFVYISYGRTEDLMGADFLTKLCYHAYDMVNILVHATELPISEKKLNKVKVLLNKYSSQDQNEFSEKNKAKNEMNQPCGRSSFSSEVTQQSELEDNTKGELTQIPNGNPCAFSDDSSISESDDEDLCHDESGSSSCNKRKPVDTCGAQWDVFRRQDVPKLVEYLRKYSNELNQSYSSPKKVIHPILDENFYLDAFHKKYLKDEFDVEPWTFEQQIGEAVIVPAGCPYQVKKIKSCVNVVLEFISPESASMGTKLSDETRQLPVNHKAKGKMLGVKKMTIHSVNAAVEEFRAVSQAENEISDKVGE
ncbi:lysine-specific demethylase JMJ25 isoform X2 [Cynara cardunculus var. scolymus]|uniref:lysine-specific demethylase JMJ25 isoform X2 n=1 Tax=Cynara cardunculus var. scolymus TaxID=59895 RepID=UPI000D62DB19|nr:lysine-specific demethylase JMJ25 isoform X2 [Cynara cardunculus var. scolymus]